jgi:hypothetical protein
MKLTNFEKIFDPETFEPFISFTCRIGMETLSDGRWICKDFPLLIGTELLAKIEEARKSLTGPFKEIEEEN